MSLVPIYMKESMVSQRYGVESGNANVKYNV